MIIHAAAVHLVALAASLAAGAPEEGGIGLTIRNELPFDRTTEGITCGVPLPKGFATGADELGLVGPRDEPVPV